ncbi:MAG: PorV/PorQ family protein [Candidatus Cloacimonetes bacterium]|nr:PorV/PorQ family protein [Candidatus Cloacimonadota bacterium]
MKLIKTLLICSLLLFKAVGWAIDDNAGTNGFNFLKINYSAKASSMAGAYTSMSGESDAYHFNPATIMEVTGRTFNTSYLSYFDGYNGGSAIYTIPSESYTLSLFGEYMNSGDIDKLDVDGVNQGTFNASDILIGASFAKIIHPMLTIGVNAKYIMETIDNNSATAIAADFGIIHQPENKHLKVGLTIRNLGYQITYFSDNDYKEKFPLTYAAGLRYTFNEKFLGAIELDKAAGQDVGGALGFEGKIHPMLALRTGYKFDADDWKTGSSTDILSGTSFGVGLNWKAFNLDYAISNYGDLGFLNHISLKYNF